MMKTNIYKTLIVLLLIMAVLIGVIAYATNGFVDWNFGESNASVSSDKLRVLVNGKNYEGDAIDDAITIEIIGVSEFSVEVMPGMETFDFRHNGNLVKFPYVDNDFNDAFSVSIDNNIISVSGIRCIEKILQIIYPGEEITDISSIDSDAAYFVVKVTGNGGQTAEIPINGFYAWMSIELDKSEIVF